MEFPQRLLALRNSLNLTQEEFGLRLGLGGNYVSLLENGKRQPSDGVLRHVELIERSVELGMYEKTVSPRIDVESATQEPAGGLFGSRRNRRIPVISWAHAGVAQCYEELPFDHLDWVPTDCPDEKAFAVKLLGDSMKDAYLEGDLLILQPSKEIHSGCLAVVKLADDGVVFRRIELRKGRVQLVALNAQYGREDFSREEIAWAYPLWGMWRQLDR